MLIKYCYIARTACTKSTIVLTTTQGDPLSMAMYALAITPLIHRLNELEEDVSQLWFVNNATAAASCSSLPNNKRGSWNVQLRRVPLHGLQPFPLMIMASSCIRGISGTALCLHYGWSVSGLPHKCCCGSVFSVDHAMTCHKEGCSSIRHNMIRDVSSNLLAEFCHNTCVEQPVLQPLNGESFQSRSANTQYEAWCDIRAHGFWSRGQDAFFGVRVFT